MQIYLCLMHGMVVWSEMEYTKKICSATSLLFIAIHWTARYIHEQQQKKKSSSIFVVVAVLCCSSRDENEQCRQKAIKVERC